MGERDVMRCDRTIEGTLRRYVRRRFCEFSGSVVTRMVSSRAFGAIANQSAWMFTRAGSGSSAKLPVWFHPNANIARIPHGAVIGRHCSEIRRGRRTRTKGLKRKIAKSQRASFSQASEDRLDNRF